MAKVKFGYDNTESVKAEANAAMASVLRWENEVAPAARYKPNHFKVGEMVFGINGQKGVVEESVQGEISLNGYWHSAEEFQATPWTDEERAIYYAFRQKESERIAEETKEFNKREAYRRGLAKTFLGR